MLRRTLLLRSVSALPVAGAFKRDNGHHEVHRSSIQGPALQPESLVYLPSDYDGRRKLPMLLWLHGASLRGADPQMLLRYGPPSVAEKRGDFPFIVLSPQCPPGRVWTDDNGAVIRLMDEVREAYHTDPRRCYLTGLCMGGGGAWCLGSRYPQLFGAIVPMCGPTQPAQWASGLRRMPVWVFHGDKDNVVPIKRSKDMVQALRRLGNKPRFSIVKGKGHDITSLYNDDAIYRWMRTKTAAY